MNAPENLQAGIDTSEQNPRAPSKDASPTNPYLNARREWNAQFGSLSAAANNWRLVALLCLAIGLTSSIGLVALGARTKTVPFVSVLDTSGRVLHQGLADGSMPDDKRVVSAMVARFVSNLRSVSSDGTVQKNNVFALFAMLSTNDAAFQVVTEHMREGGDPFEIARTKTVSVEMSSILPMSKDTYQAEWREITRDRKGKTISNVTYQALVTLRRQAKNPTDTSLENPLGLYVTDINWTKKL